MVGFSVGASEYFFICYSLFAVFGGEKGNILRLIIRFAFGLRRENVKAVETTVRW